MNFKIISSLAVVLVSINSFEVIAETRRCPMCATPNAGRVATDVHIKPHGNAAADLSSSQLNRSTTSVDEIRSGRPQKSNTETTKRVQLNSPSSQRMTKGGKKVMTSPQAKKAAESLGYKQTTNFPNQMKKGKSKIQNNTAVYQGKLPNTNTKTYISKDNGGHHFDNGWKVWNGRGMFLANGNKNLTKFKGGL